MEDTDKIKILVEDAQTTCSLTMLAPDINHSAYHFVPDGRAGKRAKHIRYGLGGVKGCGQSAIEAIIAVREESGPFTDLFDFCHRVDKKVLNRRTIESLVRAGAFDCFNTDRATLMASVGLAMEAAEQAQASINQVSLFGGDDDIAAPPEYAKTAPWTDKQRLMEEKLALGYYFSGHLFDAYAGEVRKFARAKLSSLEPSRDPRLAVGVIAGIRSQMTQRGRILIVALDDKSAVVEITVYNDVFEANRNLFKEDEFLAVQGRVSEDRFSGGIRVIADKVMDLGAARIQFGREFFCAVNGNGDAAALKKMLDPYRSDSGLPMTIRYTGKTAAGDLRFGDGWRVSPADALTQALVAKYGAGNVGIEY